MFNSTPAHEWVGYPVECRITNLKSQIDYLYLNILITVQRLLKIIQMMAEGNMNVSEHFKKHFKSTKVFRSWPSMSEVDPKMFWLYMLSNIKWSIAIALKLFFFVTFLVKQLLHLWSVFTSVITFVAFLSHCRLDSLSTGSRIIVALCYLV